MARKQAVVVMAVLALALAGCSASLASQTRTSHPSNGPAVGAQSIDGNDPQVSPVTSGGLPDDFPADVPLPSTPPDTVSAGRVPGGKRLWSLSYGDVSQVRNEEQTALKGAGYTATLESDDGTGSYAKDATSVVTAVQGNRFVIIVSTQA